MLRNEWTDEELMLQYQEGSEEAFSVLYSRHSGKILGYLKSRLRSEQQATDLFQEVFVKIHKSKHLYNKSLPVLPWIFSVTQSVLIDGLRKSERRKEVFDFDFEQLSHDVDRPIENKGSVAPMIERLSAKQQVAIEMRYLEEKTFEEIATRLKTSPTNARQIISRSLKHLKNLVRSGDES